MNSSYSFPSDKNSMKADQIMTIEPDPQLSELHHDFIQQKVRLEAIHTLVGDHNNPVQVKEKTERNTEAELKREALGENELVKLNVWKGDRKFGDFVEGTTIFPCKVFLSQSKWINYLDPSDRFDLSDLAESLDTRNLKIDVIIDLNRSFDYYTFEEIKKRCHLLQDTRFLKFKLENAAVPDDVVLNNVFTVLKESHENQEVVVMHCFNGINRTGYIICDFLCRYFGMDAEEAIQRFEKARGHKMEHQCMVEKLKAKYPSKSYTDL